MAQLRRGGKASVRHVAALAVVGVAVAAICTLVVFVRPSGGVVVERANEAQVTTSESPAATTQGPDAVVVHVDGAVCCPGVYELVLASPRVRDAVDAAGGLADGADTSSMNLASLLGDGQKIHVPFEGESSVEATGAGGGGESADASGVAGSSSLVNINSATAEELDDLPGVGPSTAAAIVEERNANGPFSSPEDLMRVSGIGKKKFAKLRDHICV